VPSSALATDGAVSPTGRRGWAYAPVLPAHLPIMSSEGASLFKLLATISRRENHEAAASTLNQLYRAITERLDRDNESPHGRP